MANSQTNVREYAIKELQIDLHSNEQLYVAYIRVSTAKQGQSGLGIDAQRNVVRQYLSRQAGAVLIQEYVEIESGKDNDRPKLLEAISRARLTGAKLIIAKLDRLSRNAHFLTGLANKKVAFVACDIPDANEFTITIMAALAQQERQLISERTKAALAAASSKGTKLGNPRGASHIRHLGNKAAVAQIKARADERAKHLKPEIHSIQAAGNFSFNAIATELNRRLIKTARSGKWDAKSVSRLMLRLQRLA